LERDIAKTGPERKPAADVVLAAGDPPPTGPDGAAPMVGAVELAAAGDVVVLVPQPSATIATTSRPTEAGGRFDPFIGRTSIRRPWRRRG
jgi:hypothetical protein